MSFLMRDAGEEEEEEEEEGGGSTQTAREKRMLWFELVIAPNFVDRRPLYSYRAITENHVTRTTTRKSRR